MKKKIHIKDIMKHIHVDQMLVKREQLKYIDILQQTIPGKILNILDFWAV